MPGQPERPASEAGRPAEVIYLGPSVPERETEPTSAQSTRETTDARQVESGTAENTEITDAKAASKARWARHGAQECRAVHFACGP